MGRIDSYFGRIGRKLYINLGIPFTLLFALIKGLSTEYPDNSVVTISTILFIWVFFPVKFILDTNRMHDIGRSVWYVLGYYLVLLPAVMLYSKYDNYVQAVWTLLLLLSTNEEAAAKYGPCINSVTELLAYHEPLGRLKFFFASIADLLGTIACQLSLGIVMGLYYGSDVGSFTAQIVGLLGALLQFVLCRRRFIACNIQMTTSRTMLLLGLLVLIRPVTVAYDEARLGALAFLILILFVSVLPKEI